MASGAQTSSAERLSTQEVRAPGGCSTTLGSGSATATAGVQSALALDHHGQPHDFYQQEVVVEPPAMVEAEARARQIPVKFHVGQRPKSSVALATDKLSIARLWKRGACVPSHFTLVDDALQGVSDWGRGHDSLGWSRDPRHSSRDSESSVGASLDHAPDLGGGAIQWPESVGEHARRIRRLDAVEAERRQHRLAEMTLGANAGLGIAQVVGSDCAPQPAPVVGPLLSALEVVSGCGTAKGLAVGSGCAPQLAPAAGSLLMIRPDGQ